MIRAWWRRIRHGRAGFVLVDLDEVAREVAAELRAEAAAGRTIRECSG
jgi:hypothetical protein